MKMWKQMSPFTRAIVVGILVACAAFTYHKQRFTPMQARLAAGEGELEDLREELDDALMYVERLRIESQAAERWASYAEILDRQTSGRSFHDLLNQCGAPGSASLSLRHVNFERAGSRDGFPSVAMNLQLQGRYNEVVAFLHQLDEAFPPVELTRTSLTLAELDEEDGGADAGMVMALMEGVLYEPQ